MYQLIDNKTEERIEQIIKGDYLSTALGTIDKDNYPLVTKIIPMYFNNITFTFSLLYFCLRIFIY